MIKMLKLSPYCFPEQVSSTHLSRDLNDAFFEAGIVFEYFVPTPSRGISKEVRDKYKRIKYEERNDGHTVIHRFAMFPEKKNPIQRAIRYVLVNIVQYWKGSKTENIDVIYSASTPPTQGFLCAKVKRKLSRRYGHNVPFIYNLQDIFPDSLVNAKMTKKGSLVWKIGRSIEDYTYKNADKIITISEDFKYNIVTKGVPEGKIVVVSNWINTENVYPVERKDNILFDRYNLDRNLFYICYSGNIGHSQNMELLLETAKDIKEDMPDVRFVLIGEGAAKESVQTRIHEENISNVLTLPFQDYSEIAYVFSLGDIGLIISKPGVGGSSVPSKTWSIMAAERPILASFDIDSDLAKLIKNVGCGIVVNAGEKEALIEGIKAIRNKTDAGTKGKKYIQEYLNKDICVGKYVETILSTLPR